MLRYLTEHNSPKDDNVITIAIEESNFDIIRYAFENDYPYPSYLKQKIEKQLKICTYLLDNL
jgi:hypothetical protein